MKSALPMNSMRFMSGEVLGTNRLRTKPARKAPRIPSRPQSSAVAAEKSTTANVNVNCMIGSLYLRKKIWSILGNRTNMPKIYTINLMANFPQNQTSLLPLKVPEIPARKSRANSKASIVAAIEMTTAGALLNP